MKRIFTMLLALTLLNLNYSCSDDGTTNSELQSINDPLKTVSLDQIKNFNQTSNSQRSARSLPNEEIQIFYEDFIDSEAQFAFELLSFTESKMVRNIYFEYEGEVVGYKISMHFKDFNLDYSGDLYIENLKTEETSLYVFESGFMTEAYDVIRSETTRSSRSIDDDDETDGYIETVTLSAKPIDKDEDRADGNVLSLSSFSLQGNSNAGVGITGGGGGSIGLSANSLSPSFRFFSNIYERLYPNFTKLLKSRIGDIADNSKIINAIKKYTNLTESQIKHHLKWGEGPIIVIADIDSGAYGEFRGGNVLLIDKGMVETFESTNNPIDYLSLEFVLAVTILHEYVHFGDSLDGEDFPGEEGDLFEIDAFGNLIWLN